MVMLMRVILLMWSEALVSLFLTHCSCFLVVDGRYALSV